MDEPDGVVEFPVLVCSSWAFLLVVLLHRENRGVKFCRHLLPHDRTNEYFPSDRGVLLLGHTFTYSPISCKLRNKESGLYTKSLHYRRMLQAIPFHQKIKS